MSQRPECAYEVKGRETSKQGGRLDQSKCKSGVRSVAAQIQALNEHGERLECKVSSSSASETRKMCRQDEEAQHAHHGRGVAQDSGDMGLAAVIMAPYPTVSAPEAQSRTLILGPSSRLCVSLQVFRGQVATVAQ